MASVVAVSPFLTLARGARAQAAPAASGVAPGWATRPWPADRPVPALGLKGLDGADWRLEALRGQPLMLNFWATWCGPCREEMPALEALARRHAPQGLVVLAINYQEGEAKIREFLGQVPYGGPIALDRDGAAAKAWTPRVFPSTVLVGRDGRPVSTLIGAVDWSAPEVTAAIERLIAAR